MIAIVRFLDNRTERQQEGNVVMWILVIVFMIFQKIASAQQVQEGHIMTFDFQRPVPLSYNTYLNGYLAYFADGAQFAPFRGPNIPGVITCNLRPMQVPSNRLFSSPVSYRVGGRGPGGAFSLIETSRSLQVTEADAWFYCRRISSTGWSLSNHNVEEVRKAFGPENLTITSGASVTTGPGGSRELAQPATDAR